MREIIILTHADRNAIYIPEDIKCLGTRLQSSLHGDWSNRYAFLKKYKLQPRAKRADCGCEFFRSQSNELVLRKAAHRSPTLKKKRGEREGEIKGKRTNKNKRKREKERCSLFRIMENVACLGMAIRKYSKSRVAKDYQLLEIKVDLFIIPASHSSLGISTQLFTGYA